MPIQCYRGETLGALDIRIVNICVISRYVRRSGQASLEKLMIAAKCTLNMHKSFSIILRFDI